MRSVGASEPVLFARETADAFRSFFGADDAEDQSASPVMRGDPLFGLDEVSTALGREAAARTNGAKSIRIAASFCESVFGFVPA